MHPPGETWATDTPRKKGEVPEAFEILDREITDLDAAVRELGSRLEPVLGQPSPHAISGDQPDRPWASTHASRAAGLAGQVGNISQNVRDLLSRLEV